ncbi:MAG: hypothetical protein PHV34_13510 [Verrucomicrobiae bacterium]|nr:hypothetical protein [Verrucomicrobiae bacterium]
MKKDAKPVNTVVGKSEGDRYPEDSREARLKGDPAEYHKHSGQHFFEARAGIRATQFYGKIRPGRQGSSTFDLRDDLGLKEYDYGPQLDFELRVSPDWFCRFSYANSSASGNVYTSKSYLYQTTASGVGLDRAATLQPGAHIQSEVELDTLQFLAGYDVFKDLHWTVSPLVGFKEAILDVEVRVRDPAPPTDKPSDYYRKYDFLQGTPMLGCEVKYDFNAHFYTGISPVAFAWANYVYAGGQWFLGCNFDRHWGLRLGFDVDYLSITEDSQRVFSGTGLLTGAYLQGVYGF